jgi:hypothetical protein
MDWGDEHGEQYNGGRGGVLTPRTVWKRIHIGESPTEVGEGDMG